MLLKQQSLTQTCLCGQVIKFPEGEVRSICDCEAVWECGPEGYWYTQSIIIPVALIDPKPLVVCSSKSKPERYERYRKYQKPKHKKKGRKGGSKCC